MRKTLIALLALSGCAQDDITQEQPLPALNANYFRCEVQPVLAARCSFMACHGNDERPLSIYAEQRFRLGISWDDYEDPLTDEERAANFRTVRGFVEQGEADQLVSKPLDTRSGGLFHRGKDLYGRDDVFLDRQDPGYRILKNFVEGATAPEDCVLQEEVGR